MGGPPVSRADLFGVLSLVSDLGMGQSMEHALRQCRIALHLADALEVTPAEREAVFSAGLLVWVGCHVDAYEQARWFGDDRALKADIRTVDDTGLVADLRFLLPRLGGGRSPGQRLLTAAAFAVKGYRDVEVMLDNHCAAVTDLARGLGLEDTACVTIRQAFERWDGRGAPDGAAGPEILTTAMLVNLADVAEAYHEAGGVEAAVAVARARRGTQFDPAVVDLFCDLAPEIFAAMPDGSAWSDVMGQAPAQCVPLDDATLDTALEAVADFTDVKSPYTLGHSRAVADLAGEAARGLGLSADDATDVRRAGLLHDLGRMGVPNSIWDKTGPLTVAEQERVRLHPYLTMRTLASCPGLTGLGVIAAQHHERRDGSGYPRALRGDTLTPAGELLAAADLYRAKLEPRPHRDPLSPSQAATLLREEVQKGRLDGGVVEAVLRAAGHRPRRRREAVGGLTQREVEVLRLLARGYATKQIAAQLSISRKTAANHIEHIYSKLGVTNRALASLVAARYGLVGVDEPQEAGLA